MRTTILALAALLPGAVTPAFAQLVSHPDAPIRIGHYHLNVTSIEAHKKFWADTLGGKAMKFGGIDVIEFPDAFIFLRVQKPTGPTRGTAFDHIGFAVPNVPAMAMKLAAAAFDATLRPGQTDFFIGADLPGVGYSLNFFRWEGDQSITHVPTAGRVVDHVGFEVKNLEAFWKGLEVKGIKATRPYRKRDPVMNDIATTTIVDPWGVSIELTEGLDKIR